MKNVTETYDVVVCGGGLAGFCAAVAAARHGARTCLVHNRPVLGGNSSSEVGVTPHGAAAFHAYARETGIISEALIEERARNHAEIYENGWTNSVWDLVLYDLAQKTPGLTLHLNTDIRGVDRRDARNLAAVLAVVQNAEIELRLEARTFIDCTGDGIVADAAGCQWRMGSEGRDEFNEPHAPAQASADTMGNSIHFLARDTGRPAPFTAPDWAVKHEDASYFYDQGRLPKEDRGGFWWIEIGVPYHTIYDAETIRHELTRHALGVWDWMKNRDPKTRDRVKNYALDWIGQVPGKRESRRILGRYLMTEHDVLNRTVFPDEIAFGGWFVDLHTPGGLLAKTSEPSAAVGGDAHEYDTFSDYSAMSYCGPYGVPLRILLARDCDNLMMAGRNVSVTHAALGTVRVMGTTALMGEAAGVAAAVALERGHDFDQLVAHDITEIQQRLLANGCHLPNYHNEDPLDLARTALVSASSEAVVHGVAPETPGFHEGLAVWKDQPQYHIERLETRRGQLVATSGGRLERLELCLSNDAPTPQPLELRLHAAEHIWDYRAEPGKALAATTLTVPPGPSAWVAWDLDLAVPLHLTVGSFLRLDALANPKVRWHAARKIIPGHMASYAISPNRMRRFGNGHTLAYRVTPAQRPFGAAQVLSGVTRPHRATNLWLSDSAQPLPQWLELAWPAPQSVKEIQLVFAGHLVREYHAYAPFYRDAQCVRDYRIEAHVDGAWRVLLEVAGNYQRLRRHVLPEPVNAARLRVVVTATNGDPSAAIYEIRCRG
ncbi:MAG: FAD-dependent oxidoreductase [Verrucomicrobiota bacterium]